MKSLTNLLLFNVCWFVAVAGAAQGDVWIGPLAFAGLVALHLAWGTPRGQRGRELLYLVAIGLAGTLADTALHRFGLITYPTSTGAWPWALVPPWITALWIGFATLPRLSLAWLARRPWWWASAFAAVGGPLSFYGGVHLGPIGPGGELWTTLGALALEYGLMMPLMLRCAPAHTNDERAPAQGRDVRAAGAETAGSEQEETPHGSTRADGAPGL